jgi:hypothetical protein
VVGFGHFTNATIDQYVRGRENDLAPVMKAHPELLSLDESTSITVHGDTLTYNGQRRATIWDRKNHDGLPPRQRYLNTATRVAS